MFKIISEKSETNSFKPLNQGENIVHTYESVTEGEWTKNRGPLFDVEYQVIIE